MADIADVEGLAAWLTRESSKLASVVAGHASLQTLSAFGWVRQDEEDNRRRFVGLKHAPD